MKTTKYFFLLLSLQFLISCHTDGQSWYKTGIKGEGPKVTETLDLPAFDAVSLQISGNVYLRQGSPQSVKIEAQQNILDQIVREVNGNHWKIKFDQNVRNHDGVKIWITIPHLTSLAVSGSGDIQGETAFTNLGALNLAVSGSGNIALNADSKSLDVGISGSGDMDLAGSTGECDIRISGSGDVEAFDLAASSCKVKISGSGDASVRVSNDLEVGIAGSGDVYYKGSPRIKSKISGSGEVTAK